jgi:hypothetical protein
MLNRQVVQDLSETIYSKWDELESTSNPDISNLNAIKLCLESLAKDNKQVSLLTKEHGTVLLNKFFSNHIYLV